MDHSLFEIFEKVRQCEISSIELFNYVEKVTDHFQLHKLKMIETEFDIFFYPLKREFEDSFTNSDIEEAIQELKKKNTPIPYLEPITIKGKEYKFLDKEKLLFPMEFYCCHEFYGLIRQLINKHSKSEQSQDNLEIIKTDLKKEKRAKIEKSTYTTFQEIFMEPNWEKYVSALQETKPPLLNKKQEFIGSRKKHKGVICGWLRYLQKEGKIYPDIKRQTLAFVVNNEIKNIELGADGKSFDNDSYEYRIIFKAQLQEITK